MNGIDNILTIYLILLSVFVGLFLLGVIVVAFRKLMEENEMLRKRNDEYVKWYADWLKSNER